MANRHPGFALAGATVGALGVNLYKYLSQPPENEILDFTSIFGPESAFSLAEAMKMATLHGLDPPVLEQWAQGSPSTAASPQTSLTISTGHHAIISPHTVSMQADSPRETLQHLRMMIMGPLLVWFWIKIVIQFAPYWDPAANCHSLPGRIINGITRHLVPWLIWSLSMGLEELTLAFVSSIAYLAPYPAHQMYIYICVFAVCVTIDSLINRIKKLPQTFTGLQKRATTQSSEIDDLQAIINEREQLRARLVDSESKRRQAITNGRVSNDIARSNAAARDTNLKKLEELRKSTDAELAEKDAEILDLCGHVEAKESMNNDLRDRLAGYAEQNATKNVEISELHKKCGNVQTDNVGLCIGLGELENQLQKTQLDQAAIVANKDAEIAELKANHSVTVANKDAEAAKLKNDHAEAIVRKEAEVAEPKAHHATTTATEDAEIARPRDDACNAETEHNKLRKFIFGYLEFDLEEFEEWKKTGSVEQDDTQKSDQTQYGQQSDDTAVLPEKIEDESEDQAAAGLTGAQSPGSDEMRDSAAVRVTIEGGQGDIAPSGPHLPLQVDESHAQSDEQPSGDSSATDATEGDSAQRGEAGSARDALASRLDFLGTPLDFDWADDEDIPPSVEAYDDGYEDLPPNIEGEEDDSFSSPTRRRNRYVPGVHTIEEANESAEESSSSTSGQNLPASTASLNPSTGAASNTAPASVVEESISTSQEEGEPVTVLPRPGLGLLFDPVAVSDRPENVSAFESTSDGGLASSMPASSYGPPQQGVPPSASLIPPPPPAGPSMLNARRGRDQGTLWNPQQGRLRQACRYHETSEGCRRPDCMFYHRPHAPGEIPQTGNSIERKKNVCRFFNTERGCNRGVRCSFRHITWDQLEEERQQKRLREQRERQPEQQE